MLTRTEGEEIKIFGRTFKPWSVYEDSNTGRYWARRADETNNNDIIVDYKLGPKTIYFVQFIGKKIYWLDNLYLAQHSYYEDSIKKIMTQVDEFLIRFNEIISFM